MSRRDSPAVKAVLGPTNTGKTHLAIERLCGHASGMIGFPLRLLAREVYDRVVAIKGPKHVGLITGEEKIMPPGARWLLCTAESMPRDRDVAFAALDEAQLGADPERGHIFTDRMLTVRGREETMILGSESLRPMVRALIPDAEIIRRPRFSTLSYAGARKLSRLPKRTAIVAFSAEEVYAVAEMLRRARGGAAVVTGALSPRTRNAQVAMYQAGEVDYLVATDAIGMGLNMDVTHVAFASLNKFDGRRQRRLTIAEMAQIAGRAGRHQNDGTFGSLGAEDGPAAFRPEEIEAIEQHRFPALDHLYWRDGDPDLSGIDALIASLDVRPPERVLRAAPEAIDVAVLKRVSEDPIVRDRARHPAMVARLWAACGLPDFRKVGPDHHARTVGRIFRHLSEGNGHIPAPWFADEIARLDRVEGDIATIGGRIAAIRTWSYIAQRSDWLAEPAQWAARAQALEEKLSDALHARLTERFVDRRTTVLMRALGNDPALLDVVVSDDGIVRVEDEMIGRLDGFAFTVDPAARTGDRKRLLAAAERRLPRERARRAAALIAAPDGAFALDPVAMAIRWDGHVVARLSAGRTLIDPRIRPDAALDMLNAADRDQVLVRLDAWLAATMARPLAPLIAMTAAATDLFTPARVRALFAPLAANGGFVARSTVDAGLAILDADDRRLLRQAGLTVGTLDLFDPRLLKPDALQLIAILAAARTMSPSPALPPPGTTVTTMSGVLPGYRAFGDRQVRIDLVERVARAMHNARKARAAVVPDPALAISFGIDMVTFAAILRACGFRPGSQGQWTWHSRPRSRPEPAKPVSAAFAALSGWRAGG